MIDCDYVRISVMIMMADQIGPDQWDYHTIPIPSTFLCDTFFVINNYWSTETVSCCAIEDWWNAPIICKEIPQIYTENASLSMIDIDSGVAHVFIVCNEEGHMVTIGCSP